MPDIFEDLQTAARGDVFDELAGQSASGDIFEAIQQAGGVEQGFVADMANRFRKGGATAMGQLGQAIARGGYAIERLAGEDANVPTEQREARLRERSALYRGSEALIGGAQEAFPTNPLRDGGLPATLAESAGAMVPTIAAGVGGRLAAALQYGATSGEQAAQEAVAAGQPEKADAAFAAAAPIGALTEGALGMASRFFPGLRAGRPDIARQVVKGVVGEAAQEGLEQIGQNVVASNLVGYDPDRPATNGLGMAMLAGGLLGGPVAGASAVLARFNQRQIDGDANVEPEVSGPEVSEFGGMGEGGVVVGTGSITQPPIPESATTLEEQMRLTTDPKSTRRATLVTPGAEVGGLNVPEGLASEPTPHGLVIFNPRKVTREEVVAAAQGERFDARLLGLSNSGAIPVTSSVAVTTSTDAAPDVAVEVVRPDAASIDAAAKAQQQAVPNGTTRVESAADVANRRLQQSEPEQTATADVIDAWLTRSIDTLTKPSGVLYADPLLIQTIGRPALAGALVAVRAVYRASRSVAQAVEAGVRWLKDQGLQVDEPRFRAWAEGHFKAAASVPQANSPNSPESPESSASQPTSATPGTSAPQAGPAAPVATPPTPAPTPPADPERKLSPRLQDADWLTSAVRERIRNRTYQPTSMVASEAAAQQLVAELGPERAERLVFDLSVDIPMAVRGGLTAAVAQEYSKLERSATSAVEAKAWRDRNADYLSRLLPQTTGFGQFINMLKAFSWQTAEGAVLTAQKLLEQATETHLAAYGTLIRAARRALKAAHDASITDTIHHPDVQEAGKDAVDQAVVADDEIRRLIRGRAVEDLEPDIRAEVAEAGGNPDAVIAVLNQFWGPNPQPTGLIPLLENAGVRPDQARTWANAWVRRFGARVGELEWNIRQTLDSERTRAKRLKAIQSLWVREREDAAQGLVRALSGKNASPEQRTAVQELASRIARRLRDQVGKDRPRVAGLSDLELLREAATNFDRYQEVWDAAWSQAKADGLAGIVAKLEQGKPLPFADARIDRAIRDKLRDWNLKLGDAVARSRASLTAKLGDIIASDAGLDPAIPAHARLRDAINERFEKVAAERKLREIQRLLKDQPDDPTVMRLRTVFQKLARLHDLDALDDARFFDAIRDGLGLRNLRPEDLQKLRDMANRLAAIPADQQFRRQEASIALLNELEKLRKPVRWWEFPMAIWYANVLSGPITQVTNLVSNALNLSGNLAISTLRHPTGVFDVARAFARGANRAWPEAIEALRSGAVTGQRLGDKWGDPGFFQKVDSRWLLPWAMVGRALAAGDLLFFHPASEIRQATLARAIARTEGKSGRALRNRVTELLANAPAERSSAAVQATREGFTGILHRRRVEEILQAQRDQQGDFTQTGRQYALESTFNNQPYGVLGLIANAINGVAKELPAVRFIVPFTNIVANVVNESLNYTPVGSVRALVAKRAGVYGRDVDVMSWADRETLADLHAKAALGSLLLLGIVLKGAQHLDDDNPPFAVYGQGPTDKGRRDTLRATGWIPNSVKIGNQYVSYLQTPAALPLAVIGNTMDAARYGKLAEGDLWNRVAFVFAMTLKSVVQQSFLDSIATLTGAIERPSDTKSGENLTAWAARTGSSFVVPNLARQIDRAFDPKVYDEPGARGALLSQLPFARRELRPALNGLGEPVDKPLSQRFSSLQKPDPVWRELARLEVGVYPRTLQYRDRTMTDDEVYEVVRVSGPRIRSRLERLMAVGSYSRWKSDQQRERLQDIIQQERTRAKRRVAVDRAVSREVFTTP